MEKPRYKTLIKRYWWKIGTLLFLVGAIEFLHLFGWPQSISELQFNLKNFLRWREIHSFYANKEESRGLNPQYGFAQEYFEYYLKERPSKLSLRALKQAFLMWGN